MSVGLIGWVARAIGVPLPRSVRLRCDGDPVVVGDGGVRRVRTRVDPRTATRRNRAGQEARRLPRPKEVAEQTRWRSCSSGPAPGYRRRAWPVSSASAARRCTNICGPHP